MNAIAASMSKGEPEISVLCRPIAETSPIPMAGVEGPSHVVHYANPAFFLLTGKSKEDLIGKTFSAVTPAGTECLALLNRVGKTGKAEVHAGEEYPGGHRFYWSYAMWPAVSPEGRRVGIVIQITETTPFLLQSMGMNQALIKSSVHQHELTEVAERLNEELRLVNDDLKQFAFAASHDLQEPLRMITNYSQLLVKGYRGQLDGEADVCVNFITKGAKHMRELLAALLSYTKVGEEQDEADEPIDLNLILSKVTDNLKTAIDESSAVVSWSDLPTVRGQDARFVQLFQNLISNAIKYRGEAAPQIAISAEHRNDEWCFAVSDNGIGIEPEFYQTIFGLFKRLHGSSVPGTGIGLAICQRVVARYRGRIWVESVMGRGTTFYFTLPISEGTQ
jgi:signal transduction histidine kinase